MLTQTFPFPPEDAGVVVTAVGCDELGVVGLLPGVGLDFGLKRLPSADKGFDGDADGLLEGTGVAEIFLDRRGLGEAAGDPLLEAAAGEAVGAPCVAGAAAFLWLRFAGEGEALGDGD